MGFPILVRRHLWIESGPRNLGVTPSSTLQNPDHEWLGFASLDPHTPWRWPISALKNFKEMHHLFKILLTLILKYLLKIWFQLKHYHQPLFKTTSSISLCFSGSHWQSTVIINAIVLYILVFMYLLEIKLLLLLLFMNCSSQTEQNIFNKILVQFRASFVLMTAEDISNCCLKFDALGTLSSPWAAWTCWEARTTASRTHPSL